MFQFPICINPGVSIGLYEMVFDTKSHFQYMTRNLDDTHQT